MKQVPFDSEKYTSNRKMINYQVFRQNKAQAEDLIACRFPFIC